MPQGNGDRDYPVLFERQEVSASMLASQGKHRAGHRGIRQVTQVQQPAAVLHIRHSLDVKHQDIHRRAASIRDFISLTASAIPVNSARATMAWPILSSTIWLIAATGCTLK